MGLDGIPVPISTPGWDNAPYTTLSQYITKDPDTGVQNVGNYRGQLKTRRRLGMNPSLELRPGIYTHWLKYKKRGEKMPAAVVLSGPPAVTFVSAQKIPESLDELEVAGGLVGSPINVVKAVTVDLLVPAEAEIVIEGFIDTEWLEPEAPFGESHGHVNLQEYNAFMDVTAITRRQQRGAHLHHQPGDAVRIEPDQARLARAAAAAEPAALGLNCVKRVSLHEPLTNLRKLVILHIEKGTPRTEDLARDVWRSSRSTARSANTSSRWMTTSIRRTWMRVWWALSYRCNPAIDMEVLKHRDQGHGPRSLAQRRRGCVRPVRRHAERTVPADLAAQARVHGERAEDLGGARPAAAEATAAVVRHLARRMGRRVRRDGEARRRRRLLGDGRYHRPEPAQRRRR